MNISRIFHSALEKIISQVITSNAYNIRLTTGELELLEQAPVISFFRHIHWWSFHNLLGIRVPLVVSFCKFLQSGTLKKFNEIILAFLSVERKTNIFFVNIKFMGNFLFEFGRYCGKVLWEPAVFHLFWSPSLTNNVFCNIFFHIDP